MFHVYEHEMVSGNRFKIGKLNYCFFSISSEGILSLIPANFVFCTNFLFISLRMFSHRIKQNIFGEMKRAAFIYYIIFDIRKLIKLLFLKKIKN